MNTLKFKKLHADAVEPRYATSGAACFDLVAVGIVGNRKTVLEHATAAGLLQLEGSAT